MSVCTDFAAHLNVAPAFYCHLKKIKACVLYLIPQKQGGGGGGLTS